MYKGSFFSMTLPILLISHLWSQQVWGDIILWFQMHFPYDYWSYTTLHLPIGRLYVFKVRNVCSGPLTSSVWVCNHCEFVSYTCIAWEGQAQGADRFNICFEMVPYWCAFCREKPCSLRWLEGRRPLGETSPRTALTQLKKQKFSRLRYLWGAVPVNTAWRLMFNMKFGENTNLQTIAYMVTTPLKEDQHSPHISSL